MGLQSKLFRGDPRLEAAAVSDPAHITLGASGPYVRKIQTALIVLDGANISANDVQRTLYGTSTASAVLAYKQKRNIINLSYQTQADNIVGKMTIASLDGEMLKWEALQHGDVQIRPLSYWYASPPQFVSNFALGPDGTGGPRKTLSGLGVVLEIPPFGTGSFEVINAVGGRVMIDSNIATIRDPAEPLAESRELGVSRNPHRFNVIGKAESGRGALIAFSFLDLGGAFLQVGIRRKSAPTKEMNLTGQFEWSPSVTDDELIEMANANHWDPATDDFGAVPGGTVFVTPTFGEMLGAIFKQPEGSIRRLNLFTHGNPDLIGFSGRLQKRSNNRPDVFLNENGPNDNLTAMDVEGMNNLNKPGVFFTLPGVKQVITVEQIRRRFAEGAMIVLYACHSGLLKSFIKSIATFFGVKVVGFTATVLYFPPNQDFPHHFIRRGMKVGLQGDAVAAQDFRTLINDPRAVTETP
jgi:peptidoglycan hydrolase-like protein with peptidoglycan-binding domain